MHEFVTQCLPYKQSFAVMEFHCQLLAAKKTPYCKLSSYLASRKKLMKLPTTLCLKIRIIIGIWKQHVKKVRNSGWNFGDLYQLSISHVKQMWDWDNKVNSITHTRDVIHMHQCNHFLGFLFIELCMLTEGVIIIIVTSSFKLWLIGRVVNL